MSVSVFMMKPNEDLFENTWQSEALGMGNKTWHKLMFVYIQLFMCVQSVYCWKITSYCTCIYIFWLFVDILCHFLIICGHFVCVFLTILFLDIVVVMLCLCTGLNCLFLSYFKCLWSFCMHLSGLIVLVFCCFVPLGCCVFSRDFPTVYSHVVSIYGSHLSLFGDFSTVC